MVFETTSAIFFEQKRSCIRACSRPIRRTSFATRFNLRGLVFTFGSHAITRGSPNASSSSFDSGCVDSERGTGGEDLAAGAATAVEKRDRGDVGTAAKRRKDVAERGSDCADEIDLGRTARESIVEGDAENKRERHRI
jgi:hypothetical protein